MKKITLLIAYVMFAISYLFQYPVMVNAQVKFPITIKAGCTTPLAFCTQRD